MLPFLLERLALALAESDLKQMGWCFASEDECSRCDALTAMEKCACEEWRVHSLRGHAHLGHPGGGLSN